MKWTACRGIEMKSTNDQQLPHLLRMTNNFHISPLLSPTISTPLLYYYYVKPRTRWLSPERAYFNERIQLNN